MVKMARGQKPMKQIKFRTPKRQIRKLNEDSPPIVDNFEIDSYHHNNLLETDLASDGLPRINRNALEGGAAWATRSHGSLQADAVAEN